MHVGEPIARSMVDTVSIASVSIAITRTVWVSSHPIGAVHGTGIRDVQLKNMAASFYIYTQGKRSGISFATAKFSIG